MGSIAGIIGAEVREDGGLPKNIPKREPAVMRGRQPYGSEWWIQRGRRKRLLLRHPAPSDTWQAVTFPNPGSTSKSDALS